MMTRAPRAIGVALSCAALACAALTPDAAAQAPAPPRVSGGCGSSALQGTVKGGADGRLRCAPGERLVVRDGLAPASAARAAIRDPLLAFMALADLNVVDEESPLRREWADECGGVALRDSFRPHETMIPALVDAHADAASILAQDRGGSQLLHTAYSFAVHLGSAVDNQQRNELRLLIDLLDGGSLVDPDSGADGYEGVQESDPPGGTPALRSPVPGETLRDIANEPFVAHGLRAAGGAPLPWFAVPGNGDVKVQGQIADDNEAWRAFARAFATGSLKIADVPQQERQRVCEDPSVLGDPSFWTRIASDPAATTVVTADADRALLDRSQWIQEHLTTTGTPAGHGYDRTRCATEDGTLLARACYSWTQTPMQFVVLDTTPAGGDGTGNLDEEQFRWLQRELISASSRYFDVEGKPRQTANQNRLVVVFAHHALDEMTNTSAPEGESAFDGDDLESLLLRFPNAIMLSTAHSEGNRVRAHRDRAKSTAFWEVSTAGIADWPSESRSFEIADNHDGTLSIFGVMFGPAAAGDARALAWGTDDSDERAHGADRSINEAWLASAAREIAYSDPQIGHGTAVVGAAKDRNVELLLPNPLGVTPPRVPPIQPSQFPPFPLPGGFPTGFPGFPTLPPPGGFPTGFPFPQPQTPPQQQFEQFTGPGLGIRPTEGGGRIGGRVWTLLLAGAAGSWWLARARVRRWMVGI